jgi:hypothetical protein
MVCGMSDYKTASRKFTKHEYNIECKCGRVTKCDDDHVVVECIRLGISYCLSCCPETIVPPLMTAFNSDGAILTA